MNLSYIRLGEAARLARLELLRLSVGLTLAQHGKLLGSVLKRNRKEFLDLVMTPVRETSNDITKFPILPDSLSLAAAHQSPSARSSKIQSFQVSPAKKLVSRLVMTEGVKSTSLHAFSARFWITWVKLDTRNGEEETKGAMLSHGVGWGT